MNQNILLNQIKPGDQVIVPKSKLNMIQHFAMYLGFDASGIGWMIENNQSTGVRLITEDQFFNQALGITRIDRFQGSNQERKQLVQEALLKLGKPYNLINYNCEHFITEIIRGKGESIQVQKAVGGLLLLGLLGFLLFD